jgi:hypothetical protein
MKLRTPLLLSITVIFATIFVATITADHAVALDPVTPLGVKDYLPACLIAVLGNIAHFFKKMVKGETDTEIRNYLREHQIQLLIGAVSAVLVVLLGATTIFKSGENLLVTAFLTGFSADSIVGNYTPKGSTILPGE